VLLDLDFPFTEFCKVNFRFTEFLEVLTRRSLQRFLHYFARRSSSLRSHYAPLVGSGVTRTDAVQDG
jgi:hypothetical protein